jgi:hypothetical protein
MMDEDPIVDRTRRLLEVAVGFSVLGAQRAMVHRREWERRTVAQRERAAARAEALRSSVDDVARTVVPLARLARERVDAFAEELPEPARELFGVAEAGIDVAAAGLGVVGAGVAEGVAAARQLLNFPG